MAMRRGNVAAAAAARRRPDLPWALTSSIGGAGAVAQHPSHQEPEVPVPEHKWRFIVNDKICVHCTFSDESDEETGQWPMPRCRELKKTDERLRVWLKRKYFHRDEEVTIVPDNPSDVSDFDPSSSE